MIPISIESIPNTDKLIHKHLSTETTMKTILSSVLCVVLMSWSTSNIAQTSNSSDKKQISNIGGTDCGTWINQTRITDKAWAVGFISGINASFSTEKNDILGKNIQSGEQIWLYVDNYCRNNPLSLVQYALVNLWMEIRTKK